MFISFEGIDGSGKSTQAAILARTLRDMGRDVVLTREPGGSPGAEEIRKLLVEGRSSRWSAETEILLFTAARRDHLERVIRPALQSQKTVITDRFVDSTRVYQGVARADLRDLVDELHRLTIGVEPDLTIIIDLPADIAAGRGALRGGPEDRFETMGLEFQKCLRQGFLDLATTQPQRIRVIDGSGPAHEVARHVLSALP